MADTSVSQILGVVQNVPKTFTAPERQSLEAVEDYSVRNHVALGSGTVQKVPTATKDIVNKAYVDSVAGASITFAAGVPVAAGSVTAPFYVNTTTSVLYFWDGTQWLALSGQ